MPETPPLDITNDEPADPRIGQLESQIAERDATIARLERRQAIDQSLHDAGAVDIETARVLIETGAAGGEIADVVADLRRRKPFLFEQRPARIASTQAPRIARTPQDEARSAADEAQTSGNRGDLMRYLRLRRKKA